MANPVTSIINPNKDHVLVYGVNPQRQLTLEQIPISGKDNVWFGNNGTPMGNHAVQQCIAAIYMRGLPTVYGKLGRPVAATDGTNNEETEFIIAQLSPVTNIITPIDKQKEITTNLPAFAAAGDGTDMAWLYFFKGQTGDNPAFLYQTELKPTNNTWTNRVPMLQTDLPAQNSRLAAIYYRGQRLVFYQKTAKDDKGIHCATLGSNPTNTKAVKGSGLALKGTSIAVTQTDDGHIFLYWSNTEDSIQRATSADGVDWKNTTDDIKWKREDYKIRRESQLAATFVRNGNDSEIHVQYINQEGQYYEDHIDTGLDVKLS